MTFSDHFIIDSIDQLMDLIEYGWGVAEYSTPEKFFGKRFTDKIYKRTPEESYQRVLKQFRKILPDADRNQIERILRCK